MTTETPSAKTPDTYPIVTEDATTPGTPLKHNIVDDFYEKQPLLLNDGTSINVEEEEEEVVKQSFCYKLMWTYLFPEPVRDVIKRSSLLIILLILQSVSGFILKEFQDLIERNFIITAFLTMLIGAGGNAGNQATIKIIQQLANGEIKKNQYKKIFFTVLKETIIGFFLAIIVGIVGFIRVMIAQLIDKNYTYYAWISTFAITVCLVVIVFVSVIVGAILPFVLLLFRLDPAHAGPIIQVLMDMIGVTLTCLICLLMLPKGSEEWLIHAGLIRELPKCKM